MSDPLDTLRAAAPAVRPSSSRDAALRAALSQPVPPDRLRRWWIAGTAAVTGALMVVAGTSVPALGSGGVAPDEPPPVVAPPGSLELFMTHPDGTVYTVVESFGG